MARIKVSIKTSFGEMVLEGSSGEELLELIEGLPEGFLEKLEGLISTRIVPLPKATLRGVVEFTDQGPIIITRKKVSQYEAIGILLYAMEGGKATASKLKKLLEASGMKVQVPARLNEMRKRGLVFKPEASKPDWKLTVQGERWIKEEVLPKLTQG
ncbi:hypothetical protein DRO33_05950 [Candidatus Bathyarchaeota archaeon]|nr:MAG: hypothetical protein DRO33_05950 [Candidatus Bathyarchaeota archaeon]